MSTEPGIASPETLLAHQGFLHGLARSLVFGDEQADDYVQETLAYALARPPREGAGLRSWLATALRNFIRQDRRARGRRGRREHVAARPEAHATLVAVDRERARRRVVDAVFRLPEPYRSVVVLRYLDDLPPREVAKALDVPVETVRTRLKRALARLRADLDAHSGGDRKSWCLALLPLIDMKGRAGAVGLLGGGLIVSMKHLSVAVVLLALLAVGVFFALSGPGESPDRPAEPDPIPVARNEKPEPAPEPEPAAEPAPAEPEPGEAAPAGATVALTFVDESGDPIPADEARRRFEGAGLEPVCEFVPEAVLSSGDQAKMIEHRFAPPESWRVRCRIEWTTDGPVLDTPAQAGRWRLFLSRPGAAPLLTEPFEAGESGEVRVTLPLPRNVETTRVTVTDGETGVPVPGAVLTPHFEFGDDQAFFAGAPVVANASGLAEIPKLEIRGRQPTWWIEVDGKWGHVTNLSGWNGQAPKAVVFDSATIGGKAYLLTGQVAAGYPVVWARKGLVRRTTVAEDGSFELTDVPVRAFSGSTEQVILLEKPSEMKFGIAKVRIRPGETTEVRIGTPATADAAAVFGRITAGGKPLPGVGVFLFRGKGGDPEKTTATDADGAWRIGNIEPGEWRIIFVLGDMRAADDFLTESREAIPLAAGEEREVSFDLPGGVVRLTILEEETGDPIAGAVGYARPTDSQVGRDLFPGYEYKPGWAAFTDEAGRVLLPAQVPGTAATVRAFAKDYREGKADGVTPGTADTPAEVTIRLRKN